MTPLWNTTRIRAMWAVWTRTTRVWELYVARRRLCGPFRLLPFLLLLLDHRLSVWDYSEDGIK